MPRRPPLPAAFLFLGAPVSLLRLRLPVLGEVSAASAFLAACLLRFGLGPALVAAELVALVGIVTRPGARGAASLLRALHNLSAAAVTTLVAGLGLFGLGATVPVSLVPSWPLRRARRSASG